MSDEIEISPEEWEFQLWFFKNYRPDPKKVGWYIDKTCRGAKATIDGAKSQYAHIQTLMKGKPFD